MRRDLVMRKYHVPFRDGHRDPYTSRLLIRLFVRTVPFSEFAELRRSNRCGVCSEIRHQQISFVQRSIDIPECPLDRRSA